MSNTPNLIDVLISMVRYNTPNYNEFIYNPTFKLICSKYIEYEESKTLYKIKNFIVKSNEEMIISFRCIINNKLIKTPARTTKCLHIECMELKTLFNYVLKFGQCPLCENLTMSSNSNEDLIPQNKLGVDSIYIDTYFNKKFLIYSNENNEFEFLIINKNTKKYRPYDPRISSEILNNLLNEEVDEFNLELEYHLKDLIEVNNFVGMDENQINIVNLLKN